MYVKPKKKLGQHFLRNSDIAARIADSLTGRGNYERVLEIGPGTGVLSQFLIQQKKWQWWGVEIDHESVQYLKDQFPEFSSFVLQQDFLSMDLAAFSQNQTIGLIGNFPYNISSQILFKALENRHLVTEVVGMFQKEVAQRIVAPPGKKVNGILSVLCQAFYDAELLFFVDEYEFLPPPKVKSAVIRLKRNDTVKLDCNEKQFFTVVKTAYNQRRKTLRNALRSLSVDWTDETIQHLSGQRAEQLHVSEFVSIAKTLSS
ncbi:MAG: 16S rRNA (adenine(1518)-N(6)/adenine(1519)-N(6))-dimethyltransferase RsmA [Bacteroidales bacterium]